MEDFTYTLAEQQQLAKLLDEFITFNEDQFLLLGEDMKYDTFLEAVTGGSVKTAVKRMAATKNRVDRKVSKAVDSTVDAALDGGKKQEIKSIREDLMRGRGKVSTILKRAFKCAIAGKGIALLAGGSAGPLGLITFILSTIRRRKISEQERRKIMFEIKSELQILDEKIKDADSDGNKKLKYQYIRLKQELERNLRQYVVHGKVLQRD